MVWRPVLSGDDAERAKTAISAIAKQLGEQEIADPTLLRGAAGVALLHGELARDGHEHAADHVHDALAAALARFDSAESPSPWLADGLTGVAWVLQQLRDVVEVDDDM